MHRTWQYQNGKQLKSVVGTLEPITKLPGNILMEIGLPGSFESPFLGSSNDLELNLSLILQD